MWRGSLTGSWRYAPSWSWPHNKPFELGSSWCTALARAMKLSTVWCDGLSSTSTVPLCSDRLQSSPRRVLGLPSEPV